MDLAHRVVGCKPSSVLSGAIGCICPDPAPCVGRLDQTLAQAGAVMLRGVCDDLAAYDAILAVDGDMDLVPEGRDREINGLAAVRADLRLGILDGPARVRVLLSAQISCAVLPALMAAFSPSELR